ncbi:sensor histidine kinase [Candidatus Enterococcus palustris]|uniref:sensor histidine kinase n=1 Tax=Candidatus Enterococcus palustris TaxID=1834189 RepID=UPI000A358BB9|nr:sensor histidine kinase KdpD [Enterococcus sp. 7F3_DIV0205]
MEQKVEEERLDPEQLLAKWKKNEQSLRSGRLKVFFGYAAGVGKTYAMLKEAHEQQEEGKTVLIGYVEPHARPETQALVNGLPALATKKYEYKGITINEFDVDAALQEKPDIILVDELAHTNAIGARNRKRYQDIEELLKAGIDVYTTVNVQHIESLNDVVEQVTGVHISETVPDTFFETSSLKVVDIETEELLDRLKQGKIYHSENARKAMANFFTTDNLTLLRGLAIRKASDHINTTNQQETQKSTGIHSKLLTIIDEKNPDMTKKCLRWTARLAQALGTEWIALEILEDTSEHAESENSKLATKLGGEVVTLESDNQRETIVQYVKMRGVTDLVMGKVIKRSRFLRLYRPDLEDELVAFIPDVDIHLVPYQSSKYLLNKYATKKKNLKSIFTWQDFYMTCGLLTVATILSELGSYFHIGDQNLILIYILFVLLVARLTTGYLWAALASIASVLMFNWFFVEPLYSLTVYKQGYPVTLIFMLLVALLVSNLMMQIKKQAFYAMKREHQLEILYELNKKYLVTHDQKEILTTTAEYLSNMLDREVVLYGEEELKNPSGAPIKGPLRSLEELAVANWVFVNQKEAGYGTDTLMGAKALYLPVLSNGVTLAVIGIEKSKENPITDEIITFIELISTQLSLAIEQNNLTSERQQILFENEKERMRGNLLRAISHDLRTPLTGISGSVETILNDHETTKLPEETKRKLLVGIKDDADWLIRMVENLLSITRINEETMKVAKSKEAAEEVVSSAIQRIKKSYPESEISVTLPDEFVMVPMDSILIEQVLFNLMENAIRHSNCHAPIFVAVTATSKDVTFEVADQGKGLTSEQIKLLFDGMSKQNTPVDSKSGMGIGLSIVKTIIMAHDGTLNVANRPQGGAVFTFTLPLERKETK